MVTCRCGCRFENSRWDSFVRCLECGRVYPNVAPDMYHPRTEEERRWKCPSCGAENENSRGSAPLTACATCGAKRPFGGWYDV